jgi:hypothetical protein
LATQQQGLANTANLGLVGKNVTVRGGAVTLGADGVGAVAPFQLAAKADKVTVTVRAGEAVEIEPELTSAQSALPMRDAVMISGVVLATAGVVVSVLALATADGDVVSHCFQGTPGCADSTTFVGSGFSAADTERLEPVETGGVLLLPLGYSLLGAGAAWTVGAWLSDDEVPWLPVLVGLGVGTLAYAVSAAAGGAP